MRPPPSRPPPGLAPTRPAWLRAHLRLASRRAGFGLPRTLSFRGPPSGPAQRVGRGPATPSAGLAGGVPIGPEVGQALVHSLGRWRAAGSSIAIGRGPSGRRPPPRRAPGVPAVGPGQGFPDRSRRPPRGANVPEDCRQVERLLTSRRRPATLTRFTPPGGPGAPDLFARAHVPDGQHPVRGPGRQPEPVRAKGDGPVVQLTHRDPANAPAGRGSRRTATPFVPAVRR